MTLRIAQARPEEAPVVYALMRAAFAQTARETHPSSALRETVDDLRERMRRGGAVLAFLHEEPVGSARYVVDRDEGFLEYERLAVHPSARGLGIGTRMVDWLEGHARRLGLAEVRADARSQMPDNRPFYLERGYEVTGYAPRYGIPDIRTHLRKRL